ncbi:MAG TPA: sugar nucleotide-binding protein [Chloroflexota bacterium]|nr:sugar nucleotide-binding protein [Chloroflexota bacterium]
MITGASGYVGGRLVERAATELDVHALWRSTEPPAGARAHRVDLDDVATLQATFSAARPEVVVHAAYDMAAGAEPNLRWTRNVMSAANLVGARLLFLSSDMVFDGTRGWYREADEPRPLTAYGVWKAQLEREVLAAGGVVARTALVWGLAPVSDNVAKLVLEPLKNGRAPRLFEDEWRTPTEVHDLACGLLEACGLRGPRILHLAGPERLSRLELGRMLARHHGYDPTRVPPFRRAEIAPDRPRDVSLVMETTREVVSTRFRGPSEILSSGGAAKEPQR